MLPFHLCHLPSMVFKMVIPGAGGPLNYWGSFRHRLADSKLSKHMHT
jgi:hypothetical protein